MAKCKCGNELPKTEFDTFFKQEDLDSRLCNDCLSVQRGIAHLSEKEMRLLCNIVGDASMVECKADDDSEEMAKAVEMVRLFKKISDMTNEIYPTPDSDQDYSMFGTD